LASEAGGESLKRCDENPARCGFDEAIILSTFAVDNFVDCLSAALVSSFATKDFLTLTKK
jgi:hypothetical protein